MTGGQFRITTPGGSGAMPSGRAMMNGLRGKCPACGRGAMFRKFLKVNDACPDCGEELHHHRADDFPAYLDIAIVGHILVPIVLAVETATVWPFWVAMTLWPAVALGMTLALLQPIKGAVVGMQWALGMHGFEQAKAARALAPVRSAVR
ncbi:MAG: DUF983 domain-containing protein [Xanthobacteraceae bacterium]|uniref:DUF983 domain-containing protein n=1 Tax=Pseudolabrys sp. TaxID=1960880 RepID=UPI003D10F097